MDPPLWRGEDDPATNRKCQWSVWKSLEAIPEREYERIGRTKPPLPVIQPGANDARRPVASGRMSYEGRRAIVTGAGSGIGQALALHLLREGARVTGVDINDAGLEPVRQAGGEALVVDLADPDQRATVIESARQDPPHFLVNAAAILQVIPIGDVDPAVFRRHFTVNVEAVWFLCRDIGAVMVEGGAIVNFSSPSARWAYTLETAVYGATKTAIQGVTRSFAIHLAPRHIRVNAISPGITDTPMQEKVLREVSALARPELRGAERQPDEPRAAAPIRAAGGDGRGGGPPAVRCRVVHHRPDHLRRWRLHHVGLTEFRASRCCSRRRPVIGLLISGRARPRAAGPRA